MEFNLNEKQIILLIVAVIIILPLILLAIIGFASLNYFGVVDVPGLPQGSSLEKVLFVGEPSLGERIVLDNLNTSFSYQTRSAVSLENISSEELAKYDIVILDQHNSADKSVSVNLGDTILKFVAKGGKLVVVLNSGIYQSVGFNGLTATDVVGWKATFGKIIPVDCTAGHDGVPTCSEAKEESIVGRIWQQDYEHPIMQGIEVAPPVGEAPKALVTLPIQADEGAKTIAYIKAENTPKSFPAILEKKHYPMGTVIYFNYDPGLTPGILTNTLNYLK